MFDHDSLLTGDMVDRGRMDSFEAKARERLSKQAAKLARKLAKELEGYAEGESVQLEELTLHVGWDLCDDSPHAIHSGLPEELRWLEVTCRRQKPGTLRLRRPTGPPAPDAATIAFRRSCPPPTPSRPTPRRLSPRP